MNEKKVLEILAEGESETVEFKRSFDKETLETVSAFANTKGGLIVIGVSRQGRIQGVVIGRETLRDWANQVVQGTGVQPSLKSTKYEGKTLVVISVAESHIRPVLYRGRPYKRVGSTNWEMSVEEITRLVLQGRGVTWDELPEIRASIDDLDPEKIKRFIELANRIGRRPIPEEEEPLKVLVKLGLIQEGKPTRAAILLFGDRPQRFYPQAILKMGRFKSETLIVDDKEIEGTLFEHVEGAMLYFRDRLQTRFEFTGEPQRKVIWEFPLDALREAVINAVCHRDYLSSSLSQVRVYDDKVVVWNPGKLPEPLDPEKLKSVHESIPRNRRIAEMFFYAGYIERWGGGTLKILEECRRSELPEPDFIDDGYSFRIIFRKDILTTEYLRNLGLNERQIKALMYVKEKGGITNKEYQGLNAVSNKTAYLELSDIVEKGVLILEGKGRQVKYLLRVMKK